MTAHLAGPDGFLRYHQNAEVVSNSPDAFNILRIIPRNRGPKIETAAATSLSRSALIGLRKEPALGRIPSRELQNPTYSDSVFLRQQLSNSSIHTIENISTTKTS